MHAALAITAISASLTLGTIAVWMLTRLVRTIAELRGITTGLNDTLRWAASRVVAADSSAPGAHELGPR